MVEQPLRERLRRDARRVVVLLGFLLLFTVLVVLFRGVLVPFLVAIFLAYLIEPAVARLAELRAGRIRLGRGGALLALYLALAGLLTLAAVVLLPRAVRQLEALAAQAPRTFQRIRVGWVPRVDAWLENLTGPAETAAPDRETGSAPAAGPGREAAGGSAPAAGPAAAAAPGPTPDRDPSAAGGSPPAGEPASGPAAGPALPPAPPPFDLASGDWVLHVDGRVDPRNGKLSARLSPRPFERRSEGDPPATLAGALDALLEEAQAHFLDAVAIATGLVKGVVGFVYAAVLVLMITAFLVADRARIVAFFQGLPPERYREHYRKAVTVVDRGLSGVVRGQILVCLVNGLLTWIGLAVLGIPYSLLLGAVAAIFSLIPIFGTILSSVPIVGIALLQGFGLGLAALGWIVIIHLLEANVINPRVIGSTAKLHPVLILFALLAGEHAFGVIGALLAVPTASILVSMFRYARAITAESAEAAAASGP